MLIYSHLLLYFKIHEDIVARGLDELLRIIVELRAGVEQFSINFEFCPSSSSTARLYEFSPDKSVPSTIISETTHSDGDLKSTNT